MTKHTMDKPELLDLAIARKHVPQTDCGGRPYTAIEREDIARFMVEGAELQRDKDYFGDEWFSTPAPPTSHLSPSRSGNHETGQNGPSR